MPQKKTKIVLDADVIIHFIKAESFSLLPDIFPEYEFLILDIVYNEVSKNKESKKLIDNYVNIFKRIKMEKFSPKGESFKEYFQLQRLLGKGESACMIYCKDNQDVLGSSNLKDIKVFCSTYGITYLTTLDFLYYAFCRKKLGSDECNNFIRKVVTSGSNIPEVDITTYHCSTTI